MPPERCIVVAVIACPRCGTDMEGTWLASEEPGCYPDGALQTCGHCGHSWLAEAPGYNFKFEAG
jgi:hypothetical protein